MTYTVSISDLRNNIAEYCDLIRQGNTIELKDMKKNEVIGDIVPRQKNNNKEFFDWLKKNGPVFSAKDHPEWATKEKVVRWLRKSRMADERTFNDPPGL